MAIEKAVKVLPMKWSWVDRCFAQVFWFPTLALRLMPLFSFAWMGRVVEGAVWVFGRKEIRRLRQNIHRVYRLPPTSYFSRQFVHQAIRHQSVCSLETFRAIQDPGIVKVIGLSELEAQISKVEAEGRGHIIVTAHLGSWELVAYFGRKVSQKEFYVLAKPTKFGGLTLFLDQLRQKMGTPVLWTDRRSLVKDMLTALKKGQSVGFVMDQKPEGRRGPVIDFFGIPTAFVSGPATMAIRTGCAVIAVFCVREGPFEYRILSRTLVPPAHAVTDEVELCQIMAREIESTIRAYPEQWVWNYKRW